MTNNGLVLFYVFEELKADRKIVAAAVANNGTALQYASEELRGDWEFILAAVAINGTPGFMLPQS